MEEFPWVNLILLIITFFTSSIAGGLQAGIDPLNGGVLRAVVAGIPFAVALMIVLGVHELGHYFAARRYGIKVTLPYFIPAPTLIGTFGAFIKMKSPVATRRQLAVVAIMGPLMGFLAALVVTLVGLHYSEVRMVQNLPADSIQLGDPLIMKLLYKIYFGDKINGEVFLHPIAFAGWIGFFVTALNLIPASQLDGGHIFFTIFERWHSMTTIVISLSLIVLGIFSWGGWIIWGVLIFLIGRKHPFVIYQEIPPDRATKAIFIVAMLLFLLTFIPVPFKI